MYDIRIKGSQNFMGLEIPVVLGGFGADKKCISDTTIAEIHEVKVFHVRELIGNNIKRFTESVDYIDTKQRIGDDDTLELLLNIGYAKQSITQAKHIYLLSERGYAKLIKIMDTDLAWEIHDKLIDEYFELREEKQQHFDSFAKEEYSFLAEKIRVLEESGRRSEQFIESINQIVDVVAAQQKQVDKLIDAHLSWAQSANTYSASSQQYGYEGADEEMVSWKKEVNSLMDIIIKENPGIFRNGKRSGVYAKVYNAMRIEDGVNWKKLAHDFKDQNRLLYVPSTITVCYCDENLRNNFMKRLRKMAEEGFGEVSIKPMKPHQVENNTYTPEMYTRKQLDEVIQPLIDSLGGEGNRGAIKRRVYGQMERVYNVSWKSRETRFTHLNGFAPKSRGQMIQSNKSLMCKYKKAVRDLLLETEKGKTNEE